MSPPSIREENISKDTYNLNVETESQRSLDELKKAFEEDIWNKSLTNEAIVGNKKRAFKLWIAATKGGKLRKEVRGGWEAYVKYQKHEHPGCKVKRPEFFFNGRNELWKANWSFEEKAAKSTIQAPEHWKYKRAFALKRGLIDKEEDTVSEWKFLQRKTKEVIASISEMPPTEQDKKIQSMKNELKVLNMLKNPTRDIIEEMSRLRKEINDAQNGA